MTQEEKQLLLKDLCARLPYEVILLSSNKKITYQTDGNTAAELLVEEDWKPYLRPMSSMTEDERKYIVDKCAFTTMGPIGGNFGLVMPVIAAELLTDFYNSHYLDWRGLIPMGLAIEAPDDMYR